MKKSLIALAVLASTGAMAQSSVTLYGIADVNLQSGRTTGSPRQITEQSGGINGSRFGLKGSEDLGGGLKALFVLESGFNMDTGASSKPGSIFNRQSYVGLAGSFGEFDIGNTGTAYDDVAIGSNPLWDGLLAPSYYAWKNGGGYNGKPGNMLKYTSPSFGGVTVAGSYALGENKSTNPDKKAIGVSAINAQYAAGPIYASIAYQEDKIAKRTYALASTVGNSVASYKSTLVNASYDFGMAKLGASYNRNITAADVKSNQYQIGVDFPVSPALVLSTGYAYSKDSAADGNGEKRSGFGLGAKYSLSKRTFVYTGGMYGETKAAVTGAKSKTDLYTVGVNHSF